MLVRNDLHETYVKIKDLKRKVLNILTKFQI